MEDYIFILIAIVLSVFGAINQNKKKKMEQMMEEEQEPEHEPSFFDQIFDDPMFREEPQPKTVREPVVMERPQIIPEPRKAERRIPEPKLERQPLRSSLLKKTEIGDAIHKNKIASSATETETETKGARYSVMSDFSLRKAIIYAEILERKY